MFKLSSRRVHLFTILFLFVFDTLSLKASTILSQSTRLATFTSGWSQTYVLTKTGDYIAPNSIKVDNKSFNFMCPGHSFLTGISTKYENGVRRFKFACSFFEDGQGKLISKTFASCNAKGWDNALYKDGASTCTASQFIGGINGSYVSSSTGATAPDEQFKAICCQAESPNKSPIVSNACSAPRTLNASSGNAGMTSCDANMVMQQISTKFVPIGTGSDHILTFTCCQLKQN